MNNDLNMDKIDDTISRHAAIDAVNCVMVMKGIRSGKSVAAEAVESAKGIIVDNIRQLPSVQLNVNDLTKDADCISRQAAIDILCSQCAVDKPETCSTIQEGDRWCEEVYTLINMPSAQPEPHWIPCSERLPKAKQKVLVQYADESMATKRCNDAGHLAWFYSNAVAWKPAPEPYKEVTE